MVGKITEALIGSGEKAERFGRYALNIGLAGAIGLASLFAIGRPILSLMISKISRTDCRTLAYLEETKKSKKMMIELGGGLGLGIAITAVIVGPIQARKQAVKASAEKRAEKYAGGYKMIPINRHSGDIGLKTMVGDKPRNEVIGLLKLILNGKKTITLVAGPPGSVLERREWRKQWAH